MEEKNKKKSLGPDSNRRQPGDRKPLQPGAINQLDHQGILLESWTDSTIFWPKYVNSQVQFPRYE